MKNKNNKITNKLISLSGLTRQSLLLLFLFVTLSSCSNILSKDVKTDNNTYVTIVPGDVSVRSVNPTKDYALEHLTSITFYAKKTGKSRDSLAGSLSSLSELYNRQFILANGAGEYTFELLGTIDGINFYDKLENVVIEDSKTNAISFDLTPVKGSSGENLQTPFEDFGGISIKLNFKQPNGNTNENKIHYKLQDFSNWDDDLGDYGDWAIVDQGDITSFNSGSNGYNSSITYSRLVKNNTGNNARLPAGQYRLTFEFLKKDTSLGEYVLINSFPYVVNVVSGRNTYLEENLDLNPVYTITYVDDGGSLAPGEKKPTKFTNIDKPSLPKMEKTGYTFKGWYSNPGFSSETGPLSSVPENMSESFTLYAKFASSVLFVDNSNGDDTEHTGFGKNDEFKTLGAAIDKIIALGNEEGADKNLDWQIYIYGPYTCDPSAPCEIPETVYGYARSITLMGGNNGHGNDSFTCNDESVPALSISSAIDEDNRVDVKIKDLRFTGGVYVDSESKLYVSGITVIDKLVVMDTFEYYDGVSCNNDAAIYLADNLSEGASITIWPRTYEAPCTYSSDVFKTRYVYTTSKDSVKISDNKQYFHVNEESGSGKNWYIDADGCLTFDCTVSFTGEGVTPHSISVPCCSTIFSDNAAFQAPERENYVFAGWVYKTLISDNPVTYDARMFVFDSEYISEVTYIIEDMELMPVWISDSNTLYVNPTSGINFVEYDDANDEILFADGSADHPYDSIDTALEAICIRNNSNIDYTIAIKGMTEEYNIIIDDGLPAKSVTFQGATQTAQGELPVDGIKHTNGKVDSSFSYMILVRGSNNKTVSVKFQNIKILLDVYDYTYKNGIALRVASGADVTLENGAVFEGDDQFDGGYYGIIGVDNGGTLTMNDGALIHDFEIKRGAVYVNKGGTFNMNGGTITGITAIDGGAVTLEADASYSKVSSFTMTGGTISGNTSNIPGSAIGCIGSLNEGFTGKITLGGTAVITSDNDIYLPEFMTIEIASELTNAVDASTKPVITPEDYTRTSALVALAQDAASSLAETEFPKFTVTPDNSQKWKINTSGMLEPKGLVAKTKPNAFGDIVLSDGTVYGNILNADAEDITDAIKNNAVAVIFYAGTAEDALGARVIGLGLHNSNETNNNVGYYWADSSAYGYNNILTDLLHNPAENIYDNDGRDNWTKLCEADSTGTSSTNAASKYPAFNWVNNYATNFGISSLIANEDWYMPSAGEMTVLYTSDDKASTDQILKALGSKIDLYTYDYCWTSSQSSSATQAYSRQGNNSTAKDKGYPYFVLACYDFTNYTAP